MTALRDTTQTVLSIANVSKSFGVTRALDDVSFAVHGGTVHALLGGNGSGKSTLIKVLAGVHCADAGEINVGGELHAAAAMTPEVARAAGVHVVHQQSTAFPGLTVAENLQLGRGFEVDRLGRVQWRRARRRAAEVLNRFGIDAQPDTPMESLGRVTQTMVAIARALQDQAGARNGVLILDEPTSSLPAPEVKLLLDALRGYADEGQAVLFVTHRLDEVTRVADRVTMLRDGRHVATLERVDVTHDRLIELMVGRTLPTAARRPAPARSVNPLLRVRGLSGGRIRTASFELGAGEIVGVAGLLGSGRSTLLRLLFGLVPRDAGEVTLRDAHLAVGSPRQAMDAGVAFVPEDRPREGSFATMTVAENLSLAVTGDYWRRGRIDFRRERRDARALIGEFGVKTASERAPFASLSGGNQQKVILARWLRRNPRLILLDEPTQGVDVGARFEIYELIRRAGAAGAAALVVASEFEELERLCHRVLIMRKGVVLGDVGGDELRALHLETLAHREVT